MQLRSTEISLIFILSLALIYIEPAVANKFETIGSGVSGSASIKIEYLKIIAFITGIIMFIAGVLTVTTRNKNSLALNHTMWKSSSIIFFILSFVTIGTGFYL